MNIKMEEIMSPATFQEILKERKAERKRNAEEKRLNDLQRIKDMKSRSGLDPLKHFPKEIWKNIMDQLDPKSRGEMCKVHDMFSNLMESSNSRDVLLPQVIPHIISKPITLFMMELNKDLGIDLFSLRSTCKSMRDAIDELLEENLLYYMRNIAIHSTVPTLSLTVGDSNIQQLETTYFSGPKNERMQRFFFRSLKIVLTTSYHLQDQLRQNGMTFKKIVDKFTADITRLLERIGGQIWRFKMHCCFAEEELHEVDELTVAQIHVILQKWLVLMPNLKWLVFSSRWNPKSTDRTNTIQAIQAYPVPFLPNLERVTCYSKRDSEYCEVYKAVLEANPHVKIIYFEKGLNLSLVEHLSPETVAIHGGDIKQEIIPRVNLSWKLKRIELSWKDAPINEAFDFFNNFPTLEHVELKISVLKFMGNVIFLRLPKLTHFTFSIHRPKKITQEFSQIQSLQFLLFCSKLSVLHWESLLWYETKAGLKEMEKFHNADCMSDFRGGSGDLSRSNIWDIFPSLDVVKVEGCKQRGGLFANTYRRRLLISSV